MSYIFKLIGLTVVWTRLNIWFLEMLNNKQCHDTIKLGKDDMNETNKNSKEFILGCHNLHKIKVESSSYGIPGVNKKAYFAIKKNIIKKKLFCIF